MDKLSLSVILHGRVAALVGELQGASLPEGVSCTVAAWDGAPPDGPDTVLITDDPALAAQPTSANVVFVGNEDELAPAGELAPSHVVEVWPAHEAPARYRCRLERLARRLKTAYDAWLYHEWLMSLIDSLPDIVWFKEKSGLHNLVNLQFCETVHKTREDTKDQGHCYIWNAPPESEYQCAATDNAVMSGGRLVVADEPVETDKGMRQFRTYKSPVRGRDGEIIGTVGLGHDVTDFTNMGMELQILINNLPYPVAIADNEWHLTSANARFCEAFGLSDEQVRGLDYRMWKSALKTETIERVDASGARHQVEDLIVRVDGKRHDYELTEPDIVDYFDNVSGHYCLFRDVTIEREFERQTLAFANTDALTGLANRRRFHQYLVEHAGEPLGLLNIDLDNFKRVNDTLGHAAGDEVLERVARLLERELGDGLVARQGGDEFAAALPGAWSEDALAERAERLRVRMRDEFAYLGVKLGCSVGGVRTDALAENPDELLMSADRRMYADKKLHHGAR